MQHAQLPRLLCFLLAPRLLLRPSPLPLASDSHTDIMPQALHLDVNHLEGAGQHSDETPVSLYSLTSGNPASRPTSAMVPVS